MALSPPNGSYRTDNGSTLEVSGRHGGRVLASFDWFEEGACCDAECNPYPVEWDDDEWHLTWRCDCHGEGHARLHPAKTEGLDEVGEQGLA